MLHILFIGKGQQTFTNKWDGRKTAHGLRRFVWRRAGEPASLQTSATVSGYHVVTGMLMKRVATGEGLTGKAGDSLLPRVAASKVLPT